MAEIIPAILTSDFDDFSQKINLLKGVSEWVQIDFIDGNFVENKTVDLQTLKDSNAFEGIKLDLHLMVKEPLDWVTRALELLPDRIIGQVEMMSDPFGYVGQVAETGTEVGVALDLETPISAVSEEIYQSVDIILVLAAKAGFSGQEFDLRVLEKIKALKQIVGDLVKIGVDCGLNPKTISQSLSAGASVFYVNHSFWEVLPRETNLSLTEKTEILTKRYNELTELIS